MIQLACYQALWIKQTNFFWCLVVVYTYDNHVCMIHLSLLGSWDTLSLSSPISEVSLPSIFSRRKIPKYIHIWHNTWAEPCHYLSYTILFLTMVPSIPYIFIRFTLELFFSKNLFIGSKRIEKIILGHIDNSTYMHNITKNYVFL
jgi:hypothetical protein